jgi:hypothetical protein
MVNAVFPGVGEALALREYRKARELFLQSTSSAAEGKKDAS